MEAQSKASNVNEGSLKAQGLVSALYDRVFGDLEIVNSVNHTALLRGYVLPKLDGATLKRFLVARKFDVEEGFKMLMNYVQWRLSNPENAVRQEDIKASLDAKKIYVGKHTDKAGRIYFVCVARKHKRVNMQETRQLIIYSLDKVASAYLTGEKGMDKLTFLMDWQNVSWENLDAQTLLAGLQTLQNYFPERLALMVMWKPPIMFWLMYKMVIPFVDEKTRGKIVMAYKTEDLEKYFCMDNLPVSVGGSGSEEKLFIPIQTLTSKDIDY